MLLLFCVPPQVNYVLFQSFSPAKTSNSFLGITDQMWSLQHVVHQSATKKSRPGAVLITDYHNWPCLMQRCSGSHPYSFLIFLMLGCRISDMVRYTPNRDIAKSSQPSRCLFICMWSLWTWDELEKQINQLIWHCTNLPVDLFFYLVLTNEEDHVVYEKTEMQFWGCHTGHSPEILSVTITTILGAMKKECDK